MGEGCVDVAHYLINRGCGGNLERVTLLAGACYCGKLDIIKELVELHKVDPSECTC